MNQLSFSKGTILENGYGIIPKKVMQDERLTIEAKAIYAYLMSYAGNGTVAFPSVNLIRSHLHISKDRYYKHFGLLTETGYIVVYSQKRERAFANNLYEIVMNPKNEKRSNAEKNEVCVTQMF